MDASTRKNIAARDAALTKTSRVTRRIAVAATAGSLVLMAGFAHLIPTHLPHLSDNGTSGNGTSGTSTGNGGGSGTGSSNGGSSGTAPGSGSGSGPSQVTSGGS
ncbi:hypothetical protein KDK95_05025 [Actinospica sp. MGRD01-02]|uniref:Uncharacterized protein n=1 Tax=Actinospica acidithermotolerans TaxID=2828514 RepID=A0A941IEV7_9ACTN|nr:hypothetical protein [Actinospica acidithermotolerans]MBR7825660.1 hypothetical protein [Actinospica acidithermotolerans]